MLRGLRPTGVPVVVLLVLLGVVAPCSAVPEDRFVFGFSNQGIPQTLTLNGSRTLSAIRQGWYDNLGFHEPLNDNYMAGASDGVIFRNFFVFGLPTRSTPITSATLNLFEPIRVGQNFGNGYSSPDPTETYRLFHVSTPASAVGNVSFSAAIFDDLGSGTSFGSVVIAPSDNGTTIHIPLNGAGVTALNLAGGGELAVGGAVDLNPVPEPTTLLLVGTGAAGVGLARWVKQRSHKRAARSGCRPRE